MTPGTQKLQSHCRFARPAADRRRGAHVSCDGNDSGTRLAFEPAGMRRVATRHGAVRGAGANKERHDATTISRTARRARPPGRPGTMAGGRP
ncbi:hypothetical protein C7S14_8308 [Burkholderia cepacia]|nr:hypothetical protein C7S14_8308 [Burkholderia cepacia]